MHSLPVEKCQQLSYYLVPEDTCVASSVRDGVDGPLPAGGQEIRMKILDVCFLTPKDNCHRLGSLWEANFKIEKGMQELIRECF